MKAIAKAGMDLISSFLITAGTEGGKRIFDRKAPASKESNLDKIKLTEKIFEIIYHPYDWETINQNVRKSSEYAKLLIPVAGTTLVAFACLPVLAGASVFALAGPSAASMVYGAANGLVILGGAYEACNRLGSHGLGDEELGPIEYIEEENHLGNFPDDLFDTQDFITDDITRSGYPEGSPKTDAVYKEANK